jgi:hypothetical protein
MKRLTVIAVLASGLLASCSNFSAKPVDGASGGITQSSKPGEGRMTYKVASVQGKIPVFKTVKENFTNADISAEAKKFDISGTPVRTSDDQVVVSSGVKHLVINTKFGTRYYQDVSKMWGRNDRRPVAGPGVAIAKPSPPAVPDERECEKIARKFIQNKAICPLDNVILYQVNEFSGESELGNDSIVYHREVVFRRKENGRVLHGSGSQVSIFIGDRGEVIAAYIDMPSLESVTEVDIVSPTSIDAQVSKKVGKQNDANTMASKVIDFDIKDVSLGYVAFPLPDGSRRVSPAFVVCGEATKANNSKNWKNVYLEVNAAEPLPSAL